MQSHFDLLIVGGGMAAGRLLQQLHELDYKKSTVVVSHEACTGYNRVLLPGFLAGHYQVAELTASCTWMSRNNFTVLKNTDVHNIDLEAHTANISPDVNISFSELVLATGSTVPRPELPGANLQHVAELRSLSDAEQLTSIAADATDAVVIGGGLLGLEAADALNHLGLRVRVIHRGAQLMNRQLDQSAGEQLARALTKEGIAVNLGAEVKKIIGNTKVSAVVLNDGTTHPADLILFATGAQPNTTVARQAGVKCDYGICTDEQLRTNKAGVYALGECANVAGAHYSLVEATHAQADALAKTLSGNTQSVEPFTPGTRLKVSGIALFAAGETRPPQHESANDVVIHDGADGIYRRLLFNGSKLIGAVLVGNTNAAREITQRIGTAVDDLDRDRLVFGIS